MNGAGASHVLGSLSVNYGVIPLRESMVKFTPAQAPTIPARLKTTERIELFTFQARGINVNDISV
jgi:hypothetical protein